MPALPGGSITVGYDNDSLLGAAGYDALAGGDTLEFGTDIDLSGLRAYFHSGDSVLNYGGVDCATPPTQHHAAQHNKIERL